MTIKCIFSDVDGCISPEDSRPWAIPRFAELARRLHDADAGRGTLAPLTLCTGRPQPYVEALMKLLAVRLPAICENGAVIYDLPTNTARYGPGVTHDRLDALRRLRNHIERELLPDCPGAVLQFGKDAQVSVFSQTPEILDGLRPRIEAFVAEHGPQLDIGVSHFYLNISLAGVSKGAAVRHVMDELDLGPEDVAGIGDTDGDLPLREAVGFFACPANSTPAVRAVADYVSPHPELEGMLDILDRPELQR